jgi:DNA-binding NtrC family response regulator
MHLAGKTRRAVVLQGIESPLDLSAPLVARGWQVRRHADLRGFLGRRSGEEPAVGVVVLDAPDRFSPSELAELVADHQVEWIAVVTREVAADPAIGRILALGFYDFHTLPLDLARLEVVMGHAHGRVELRRRFAPSEANGLGRYGMIGRSAAMLALYRTIDKIVRVDAPVLLSGESGTGKEIVARAVHEHSSRRQGPFVPVNCGALPVSLVQSELFGYERGAFTGASQRKAGSIEAAGGGTIFLDEIGDLPLESQASLLRFLQERTIVRVGATQSVRVDARVIAATHVDLAGAVRRGRFREDLFYRLNVLNVSIPALRDRPGDVLLLAEHVFEMHVPHKAPNVRGFSGDARACLDAHDWPGNVRELINRVLKAMIMCEGRLIMPSDLGLSNRGAIGTVSSLEQARSIADRDLILNALERNRHNMAATARQLGISRVTLYRLMNKLAIDRGVMGRGGRTLRGERELQEDTRR